MRRLTLTVEHQRQSPESSQRKRAVTLEEVVLRLANCVVLWNPEEVGI